MTYETGLDGVLTEEALCQIISRNKGDSFTLSDCWVSAEAQHQADVEKVEAIKNLYLISVVSPIPKGADPTAFSAFEACRKAVLKALGAEMMEGG